MNPDTSSQNQFAAPADWSVFYKNLQTKGKIPDATNTLISRDTAVFRSMAQNLQDVDAAIRKSAKLPSLTTIYADVLIIPRNMNWLCESSGLVIYARRIEVAEGAGILLDYTKTADAQLFIFAQEISGTLSVEAINNLTEAPVTFTLTQNNITPGVTIGKSNGHITLTPLSWEQGKQFQLSNDMQTYLGNAFIYASLLYDQQPQLAVSIFLWVKAWASLYEELEELFYRSTTLLNLLQAQINASANGAVFVPYLTSSVYTTLAGAFANQAAKYENSYMQLYVCKTITEEHIAMAKTMVENSESEHKYVEALLTQAKANYQNAVAAVDKAQSNFKKQQTALNDIAAKFEQIGIPDYQREQIIKAIVGLVTAVVTFAGAIGGMAMGNAAGAPAAAESAIGGVTAVAKAAETTAEVAKSATALGSSMKELKKLLEALKKVYDLSKAVMAVVSDIKSAKGQIKVIQAMDDNTKGVDLSAADGWAVYKIQSDNIMEDPVKKGIGYAKDYKEAIDILVVYGQSLSASQLAVIKAGQEVAAIAFQLHYAEEKQANLKKLVDNLKEGEVPVLAMMQQFFQKYIDAKSSLFTALKSYQASYFYWALGPSTVRPQIIDPVTDLNAGIQNITKIAMDTATALEHFEPPPQTFKNMFFEIDDPEILEELRTTSKASWILPLENIDFDGLNRTRLKTIRVWLEGAVIRNSNTAVSMVISTSGNYLDRYKNKNYQFNSKRLSRTFQYLVKGSGIDSQWKFDDGSYGFIRVDGTVDKEVAYAYFEPTPFSEWSIAVETANHEVDLSKVTRITMSFEGSTIGTSAALNRKSAFKEEAYAAASE